MADTQENSSSNALSASANEEDKSYAPEMSTASAEEADTKDKESSFAEIAAFFKKYTPGPAVRGRRDMLDDRYLVKSGELIKSLSKNLAVACEVEDEKMQEQSLYGMILPKAIPYRLNNMEQLAGVDHPNILPLLAYGNVEFSEDDRCRLVVVHEQPTARTLRQVLQDRKSLYTERYVIDEVIAPLSDALMLLKSKNIAHASINLDTVFLGEKVMLGECVSEPAGYAQHYLFESPERSQASRFGKGEATIVADCYALGILALHMMLGVNHFDRIEEDKFMKKRLTLGTYNTLVGGKEFKGLEDFLKGTLNDDARERWTPEHIEQWVRGKKYN
ncbi:MAG: hypothetical protein MK052_11650, partial [Alphaproteobacteria bacterium]|nr:hypothetical protein [Alphaproteobacteria bacterium]